jgi:transposase
MATAPVADERRHPHRSTEAWVALSAAGQGLLGREGSGGAPDGGPHRPPWLAHLLRRACGLSQRRAPDIAACGTPALKELQRVGHRAHAPPAGGPWQAWYARLCRRLARCQERAEEAGRLVRRVARAMASLGVLRRAQGVASPPHLAARG